MRKFASTKRCLRVEKQQQKKDIFNDLPEIWFIHSKTETQVMKDK